MQVSAEPTPGDSFSSGMAENKLRHTSSGRRRLSREKINQPKVIDIAEVSTSVSERVSPGHVLSYNRLLNA